MTIKICGITTVDDARFAVAAGADFLGLIRAPSARQISAARAGEIAAAIAGRAQAVLLFQNAPPEIVVYEARAAGVSWVQLHGDEPVDDVRRISSAATGIRIIRAWPLAAAASLGGLERFLSDVADAPASPEVLLLDSPKGLPPADESVFRAAAELVRAAGRKVWRAGGLTPENVAAVVAERSEAGHARYDGVDVARGVETDPGVKDPERVRRFIQAARP